MTIVLSKRNVMETTVESTSIEELGDHIKVLEVDLSHIPSTDAFIIRLDGHCFHTFTAGFELPFDESFRTGMVQTACDLLTYFHATTVYTHSDEITLIFAPANPDTGGNHGFSGRVMKMVSLCAGYASCRFNYHVCQLVHEGEVIRSDGHKYVYSAATVEKVHRQEAIFDGRVVLVKEMMDICRHQLFRGKDCYRNALEAYCRHIGKINGKKLGGLNNRERKKKLMEVGFDFDERVPLYLRYGVYIKKEKYLKPLGDGKTVERSRVVAKTIRPRLTNAHVALYLAKLWPEKDTVETGLLPFKV